MNADAFVVVYMTKFVVVVAAADDDGFVVAEIDAIVAEIEGVKA